MINSNFKIDVRYGQKDPSTNEITWKSEKQQNLINNNGLAMLADYWATECTQNVYLESGGTQNARSSGTILLEQTLSTVTSDDPFFFEADAVNNRLLVFADGRQAFVVTYVDSTEVIVNDSKLVSAQIGSIYYVEESLMDGFVKASTTYETFGGANENTWNVAANVLTITNKRTVQFPIEGADVTYKGVGWTPLVGDNKQVFGRKVLDITVDSGSQPIVEVTLTRKIEVDAKPVPSPIIVGVTDPVETMNMMGHASWNTVNYWSSIDANGLTVAPVETSTFMECKVSENAKVAIGEYVGAITLPNIDITGDTYSAKSVAQTHTAGTFYSDYIATFSPADMDTLSWNTVALLNDSDETEAWFRVLFTVPQNFSSRLLKGLRIRKSWNRYY